MLCITNKFSLKALREVVFGTATGASFNAEWRRQNFMFSSVPKLEFGLIQHKVGIYMFMLTIPKSIQIIKGKCPICVFVCSTTLREVKFNVFYPRNDIRVRKQVATLSWWCVRHSRSIATQASQKATLLSHAHRPELVQSVATCHRICYWSPSLSRCCTHVYIQCTGFCPAVYNLSGCYTLPKVLLNCIKGGRLCRLLRRTFLLSSTLKLSPLRRYESIQVGFTGC